MDDTTITKCAKLIDAALMLFMQNGTLKQQQKLLDSLNSLVFCMAQKYSLSKQDTAFMLYLFWEEYNQGCITKMSNQYINTTLIPAVFTKGKKDVILGSSILLTLENAIK